MRYAKIMKNDIVDGENICVSFWVQGCPHKCAGCHNPETWSFDGGMEIPENIIQILIAAIQENGIQRNFSILGGEPLCPENIEEVSKIIQEIRFKFPTIRIFLWTGYTLEELLTRDDKAVKRILKNIDVLIDGRFEIKKRDITLHLRGSSNQRILYKNIDF